MTEKWTFWGRLILEVNDSKFNKNSVLDIVLNLQEEKGEVISAIFFLPQRIYCFIEWRYPIYATTPLTRQHLYGAKVVL